jgi:hypothetical protein
VPEVAGLKSCALSLRLSVGLRRHICALNLFVSAQADTWREATTAQEFIPAKSRLSAPKAI